MKTEKFNWSDAWLLLAIIYASSNKSAATLEKIIDAGDWINHAVFNADEMESGLSRLVSSKYIEEQSEGFSVLPKIKRAFIKISSAGRTVSEELEYLRSFIDAATPDAAQPQTNDLKYEGFSYDKFREAVNKYLSR